MFPFRVVVGKGSSRARILALYAYEFRTRPAWIAAVLLALVMLAAATTMLIAGGPLPWVWCVVWILGTLWGVVPVARQLAKNVREAEAADKPGDIIESAFDDEAMWVRNVRRYYRFPFSDYEVVTRSVRFGYLRPRDGRGIGVVLPTELFPSPERLPNPYFQLATRR